MIIKDVGMCAIANARSMCYLEKLAEKGYTPSFVLFLQNSKAASIPGQNKKDLNGRFLQFIKDEGIKHLTLNTIDVNSEEVAEQINKRPEKYFIYSGPGGAILGDKILSLKKKFLHIHSGRLPHFRGSTTIYYHILAEGKCGVSAIFLTKKIDTGPVIASEDFPLPKDTDIDYKYDPMIRAELLVKVIGDFMKTGKFNATPQKTDEGETYFIMHPVLRHVAKLKVERCH